MSEASAAAQVEAPLVLVADDDSDILKLICRHLVVAGYRVAQARDGAEAIALAGSVGPDLVVLDVSMPHADGYEVCRQIQKAGPSAPPVIFLTAQVHTEARVAGLDAGAVDYLVKPFSEAELTARVRAALRTRETIATLSDVAARDPLTGVLNRRRFDEQAHEACALATRYRRPLSCLMLDLDRFKDVNDAGGHAAGDTMLRSVADRLQAASRTPDVIGRYGGDEFVMLLPETDLSGATVLARRIEASLRAESGRASVEASIGVAEWQPDMETPAALYAAADEALYRTKRARRRVSAVEPS